MKQHEVGLLAAKHWFNDLRSSETRLLIIATLLAALSMSMISSFSDRLSRTMHYRASELIAGDVTLYSTRELSSNYISYAESLGLETTTALGFSTMAFANDQLQLVRVRSVQANYPLKGYNQVADGFYGDENTKSELLAASPEPGTVWAEERILQKLNINLGDTIEVGNAVFKVTRILQQDADRSGSLFSPFGRMLMAYDDVPSTGVVNQGSRIFYKQYYTGNESQLSNFVDWLKPQLNKADRLAGIEESQNNVGNALQKAQQYLSLASLISVLLAAVAIALCAKRYSERHYNTAALLRCLGASSAQVRNLFMYKLIFTAILGAVIGAILGFVLHFILLQTVADILPKDLMPARALPVLISLVCAALVLILIALAPILNLNQVSPVRVLRRELAPQSVKANVFFVLAVGIMLALAYLLSGSIMLSVVFVVGLAVLLLVYGVLSSLLLKGLVKVQDKLPKVLRVGLTQLDRHQYYARSQVAAFAFIFTSVALIWLVRGDLFDDWQQQVPKDTPNHFAINILPEKKAEFAQALQDKGLATSDFYPMVRGRLTHINAVNVNEIYPEDEGPNALKRELNLTWSTTLTKDEAIEAGDWFDATSVSENAISVESELARRLNLNLGDSITFNIAGSDIVTKVKNFRSVKWENFRPNFYVVFADGVLNDFHHTYINSFYLPPSESRWLIDMNQQFKAITIIEIEQILKQVREILAQTSVAVEAILALVLVCAMVLMFATLLSTLSLRKHEAALYRTFGASEGMIRGRIRSEYITLALVASVLAIASFEVISLALYVFIFDVSWRAHFSLWLGIPALALASILISGFWANRDVLKASPRQLLQDIS
ncbi:MAG: FtsX-like permease family protein [Gammaproteobacteria bacterium]|nr:FtsX-like permease family protein [Gammaproteobacteria bacterium]